MRTVRRVVKLGVVKYSKEDIRKLAKCSWDAHRKRCGRFAKFIPRANSSSVYNIFFVCFSFRGHSEIKNCFLFLFPFFSSNKKNLQRLRISFLRIDSNLFKRNRMVLFEFHRRGLGRRIGDSKNSDLEVITKFLDDRSRKQEKTCSR